MNTPSEKQPAPSPRGCNTCVPMLAAEAAVRRFDAQREAILEQETQRKMAEINKASNVFVYLLRKWRLRSETSGVDIRLAQAERYQSLAVSALEKRREQCPGQRCDDNGQNYRCGFNEERASD